MLKGLYYISHRAEKGHRYTFVGVGNLGNLREPTLSYKVNNKKIEFKLTKDFTYDGASRPSIFAPIIPRIGKNGGAALVHDFLYKYGKKLNVSRYEADHIFYQQLVHDGVKPWKAKAMYLAVRAFGWAHYGGG